MQKVSVILWVPMSGEKIVHFIFVKLGFQSKKYMWNDFFRCKNKSNLQNLINKIFLYSENFALKSKSNDTVYWWLLLFKPSEKYQSK